MIENSNEYIKTFLKIEKSRDEEHSSFTLDENHKIFSLNYFDKEALNFEFDKIFIDEDENSYIYEIIGNKCVTEFIKGINYCFISFGETVNKKFETLIGDLKTNFTNINNYGILMRFLDELLKKKNQNKFDYSIKFSNFLIYEDNLVDLTKVGNTNQNDNQMDLSILLSNTIKIKSDSKIINKMNQINLKNYNEIINYLHCIHDFLSSIKEKKIYNKFNICFIIYLFDEISNKIISKISFIILLGSENLYEKSKYEIKNGINMINNAEINERVKYSIEARYIFNSVINSISNNINNNNLTKIKKIKQQFESKLTKVLESICFDKNISDIKFRIIGNIKPITGYNQNTKEVLTFLFDCWKILNCQVDENNGENNDIIKSSKNDIDYEKMNLKIKINEQKMEIINLKNQIKDLNYKIKLLELNYQKQINAIKNYFEFDGDINILLSGDENTKEMKFVRDYKNCKNIAHNSEEVRKKYEKNIEESKFEIEKLKSQLTLKNEQQDMIIYYLSSKNFNNNSKQNLEEKNKYNVLSKQIEELSKIIKNKDKIISSLEKEIEQKAEIIFTLSKSKINKNNTFKNESKYSNNSENKENRKTEFNLQQEIENMKLKEKDNLEKIKTKYESIMIEKDEEIYKLQQKLDGSEYGNKNAKKELIKIYTIFMDFITLIGKNKNEIIKNIEEIERIILEINNKINDKNFPNLFEELKDKNKSIINIKQIIEKNETKNLEIKLSDDTDFDLNINKINENSNNNKLIEELKERNKILSLNFELHLKKINDNLVVINSQKRTIEKLERELNKYKQILQNKKFNNKDIFILSKYSKENKIMKQSMSFDNNELLKIQKPFKIKRNKRQNDIYNYDSFREQTKNSTNINNFSYQNTNNKNKSNYKNMKELILIQKRINNISKNKRPFSIRKEDKNKFIFSTK